MSLKKTLAKTSSLLAPLIALALVGYIGYLVMTQYRTQVAIQEVELRQLTSDSVQRATAVSYFFAERRDDLKNLAQSREVSAYFENRALGMSMEYGLRASLIMIDDLFGRVRESKRLVDAPVFERIVFVDRNGELLADTGEGKPAEPARYWSRFLSPDAKGPTLTASRQGGAVKVQVSSPCFFKDSYAGQVVSWISADELYHHFVSGGGAASRYPVALVHGREYLDLPPQAQRITGGNAKLLPSDMKPLAPYLMRQPGNDGAQPGSYAILVPVEGTPLSLVTFIPSEELSDLNAPRRMLYTTGGIAFFMLIGMFYFQRISTSHAVLQVHLEETMLREAAVDEKNRQLAAEIDERCHTEMALRESEARFRAIVGAVPVVIYEYRLDPLGPRFSFMSEKIVELTGVTAGEILADRGALFGLVHPEDAEAMWAAYEASISTGSSFSHEARIVTPSGEIRWILANSLPKLSDEGGERVWYGCLEDVTDRKQADLSLRESRQQLLDIIAFLPDATLVVDRQGRVVAWNKAMEVMTGVKAEEMIGKGDYEYALPFYGERRPILIDLALNAESGEDAQRYAVLQQESGITYGEAYTMTQQSRDSYLAASASVLRDSKGEVVAAIECIRDSTERVKAERLLRESEATLRALMDAMPAGVWWFNEAGKVEYLNSRFVELFGFTLKEIPYVQEWFRRAYPEREQREALISTREALTAEAKRSGTPVPPQETMVTCRDGSVRHIIVNTQFCQGHTLEIFTDITQQEFINNELLKVQKMESLGVLAGGIAHDFNNILTGIMGSISFAQMILEPSHEARIPLQAAEKASQRAAELAHQLLTFARGGEPIKKAVDVRRLVAESLSLSLRGTSVQGRIEIPRTIHSIEADEGQLHQAFNNIAINAVYAMSEGGVLTVSGENVTMKRGNRLSLQPGPYVKLQFRDEGCGIEPETLKKIFDPYFSTKSGGNGLGLASTLSIVRRHGGHIVVKSEVGAGTSFTLYLPSTGENSGREQAQAAGPTGTHAGGRVLVMDDEEMLRMLSEQILAHLGYEVTTCANGEEAIALYAEAKEGGAPYLAVLMDLTIQGGMGGKEAAQHIIAYDPEAKLIVSSGYSNDLALSEYQNYGFCGAVIKPYKAAQLAETLAALHNC